MENFEDLFTTYAALNGLPDRDLSILLKSKEGKAILKKAKDYGEKHPASHLHEHPARGTEGKDKKKWGEAVEAATKGGKKESSYALAQYIHQKMTGEKNIESTKKLKDKKKLSKPGFGLFGEQTSYGQ